MVYQETTGVQTAWWTLTIILQHNVTLQKYSDEIAVKKHMITHQLNIQEV